MNWLLQNTTLWFVLAIAGIVLCTTGCSRHDKVRTRMMYLRSYIGMALLACAMIALTKTHG